MGRLKIDTLDILLFVIPLTHLLLSPHTKVEESFNLQATHDILLHGTPTSDIHRRLSAYDHFSFPGVVPRTFLGALALATLSRPLVALLGLPHGQLVVRCTLGLLNAASLAVFRSAVSEAFGSDVAACWAALTLSQFHLMYYLTRTLPNMFAFGLTTTALAFSLPKASPHRSLVRRRQAIALLVVAAAVFRSELALLLAATGLHLLLTRRITPRALVCTALAALAAALAVSVPLDSYFWQTPVWPELSAFYFNVVRGSASAWGVSPWHHYFSSALPRLLLNPLALPLALLALLHPGTARQARDLVAAPLLFVAIYSLQPHKEARFVFYAVPSLTAAAALGFALLRRRAAKSPLYRVAAWAVSSSILASLAIAHLMLLISALSYPGGDAVAALRDIVTRLQPGDSVVTVHADVLTCMTGLTRFAQSPPLVFDKTEQPDALASPRFWTQLDYALMEDPSRLVGGDWAKLGEIRAYDGFELLRPGQPAADQKLTHESSRPLGLGALVARVRDSVRQYTGGWWLGPRMAPRIYLLKRVGDSIDVDQPQHHYVEVP